MSGMDAQQKRQRGIILGIGGPIVAIFLLSQMADMSVGELWFLVMFWGVAALVVLGVVRLAQKNGEKPASPAVSPAPQSVPAGWYPDQVDPRYVRWFDGTQWTDAVLPAQGPNIPQ